jgi:hypothetical protein
VAGRLGEAATRVPSCSLACAFAPAVVAVLLEVTWLSFFYRLIEIKQQINVERVTPLLNACKTCWIAGCYF